MPKIIETKYICDRCGREIKMFPHSICKWRMLFKWFIPAYSGYRTCYLCNDCWESFKEWYGKDVDNVGIV